MIANVILAKCAAHKKLFGIRIEKQGDDWVRTWAFPIDEERAKNEGFDKTEIAGSLKPTPEYPGCPYCKGVFLLQCTCGNMICCENKANEETGEYSIECDRCGKVTKDIEFADKISVQSGDY